MGLPAALIQENRSKNSVPSTFSGFAQSYTSPTLPCDKQLHQPGGRFHIRVPIAHRSLLLCGMTHRSCRHGTPRGTRWITLCLESVDPIRDAVTGKLVSSVPAVRLGELLAASIDDHIIAQGDIARYASLALFKSCRGSRYRADGQTGGLPPCRKSVCSGPEKPKPGVSTIHLSHGTIVPDRSSVA